MAGEAEEDGEIVEADGVAPQEGQKNEEDTQEILIVKRPEPPCFGRRVMRCGAMG